MFMKKELYMFSKQQLLTHTTLVIFKLMYNKYKTWVSMQYVPETTTYSINQKVISHLILQAGSKDQKY